MGVAGRPGTHTPMKVPVRPTPALQCVKRGCESSSDCCAASTVRTYDTKLRGFSGTP